MSPNKKLIDGETPEIMDAAEIAELNETAAIGTSTEIDTDSKFTGQISIDTEQIIRQYFLDHGTSIFGLKVNDPANKSVIDVIADFAHQELIFTPTNFNTNNLHTNLGELLYPEQVRKYLVNVYGEYVKEMDLFKNDELIRNLDRLKNYVPEIEGLSYAAKQSCMGFKYLLPLSMNPDLRDLVIVTMVNRTASSIEQVFNRNNSQPLTKLKNSVPSFRELFEAAKKYEVKEIQPTMEEMNRVIALYVQNWVNYD